MGYQKISRRKWFVVLLAAIGLVTWITPMNAQETTNPLLDSTTPAERSEPKLSPWEFGLGFGMQWNAHVANFISIPGIPTCSPGFEGGSSISASLGLFGGYRVLERGYVELSLLYARKRCKAVTERATLRVQR